MDTLREWISSPLGQLVLNALYALLILIVGWIVSRLIARVVRGILRRIKLDQWITDRLSDAEETREIRVENVIVKVTYYVLMLFVLAGVFEQLGMLRVAGPITEFLDELTSVYLPRLLYAGAILFVGWLVAWVLKFIVRKTLSLTKLDERMGKYGALEEGEEVTFSESLANIVFWFTLFVFLSPVLSALGLQEISQQFHLVIDQIFAYIPNILAAGMVLIVGVLLARAIRVIVRSLLKSIGTDTFGQKIGLSAEQSLSDLIASLLNIFLLMVIIVTALGALNIPAISDPMTEFLSQIINAIPGLLGAIILLAVTYAIARIVTGLLRDFLTTSGFDLFPKKIGLRWSATTTPSQWVGRLTLIVIMLFATTTAFELLGSAFLVETMNIFIAFVWQVFLAAVIFAFGLYFANLAYRLIKETGVNQANLLGRSAQVAVIIFAGAISLQEIGVGGDVINLAFGISFAAAGLAIALAFGLGSQEIAARELENVIKAFRSKDE